MHNIIKSCAVVGLDCQLIEVEVDLSRGKGFFAIVGLPDKSIKEAEQRLRAAIKNSGLDFPATRRLLVNLAPADCPKVGSSYDLPVALGIALEILDKKIDLADSLFVGELSLEGKLRHNNGILPVALYAKERGFKNLYLPRVNLAEASLVTGLNVVPLNDFSELLEHLLGEKKIESVVSNGPETTVDEDEISAFDLANIKGQMQAKRALMIAAAGGHNLLLSGPPGSGKTLLARALPGILPPLALEEILEVTKIYSVAGKLNGRSIIKTRPFRTPHHSSSGAALIGGGRLPSPGEVSLAHRGVLFLDEFAEFPRLVLDNLRQPLEDGVVTISRAAGTLSFPARFMLVASQNPCPCGYSTDPDKECLCTAGQLELYRRKISGPILDRIDLHVEAPRVKFEKLLEIGREETSAQVKVKVLMAREVQKARFVDTSIITNAEMTPKEIGQYCVLDKSSQQLLGLAMDKLQLSARSYHRILKIARTIADLAGETDLKSEHIAEALQFRPKN